jgi:hypothetical protein
MKLNNQEFPILRTHLILEPSPISSVVFTTLVLSSTMTNRVTKQGKLEKTTEKVKKKKKVSN